MYKYLGFVGKGFGHASYKKDNTIIRVLQLNMSSGGSTAAQGVNTDRFGEVVRFLQQKAEVGL